MNEPLTAAEPETKRPRSTRKARIGDAVHYWRPGARDSLGPADKPCHAIVANIVHEADQTVTLAFLNTAGGWIPQIGVRFSEQPKTNCWTWPK